MVFTVNDKTLVVQSNRLIEAKYRLSVEEQKIIKILISQIQRDDKDFRDYEFRIKDLAEILGMGHKDIYRVLPKITERLMSRVLKFYNPETQTLLQASWLSSALYKKGDGTVSLRFDPYLKPLLLQLQSYFTKYELGQIMQFKGQYTIRFFELRKSFLGRNKKEIIFSLKELWEMLGLRKDEYKIFRDFKNRVLEPARIELVEKTEESFSWEAVRQGRGGKVVGVRFVFEGEEEKENKRIPLVIEGSTDKNGEEPKERQQLSLAVDQEPEPKEKATQSVLSDEAQSVFDELLGLGVGEKMALVMVERYSVEQIREKMEILKSKKDIHNEAGFVVQAVRDDWHDGKVEKEKRAKEERQTKEDREARKRWLRGLKNDFEKHKQAVAFEQYQKQPEDIREQWKSEFASNQPFFARLLRKGFDFENGAFRAFVMQRLALPTFDDFTEKKGVQLSDDDRLLLNQS